MKFKFRKISALALALLMMLATATTAFAQEAMAGEGAATITISNASKGETYTVHKIFNATVTGEEDGSISYQMLEGQTKEAVEALGFTVDANNQVTGGTLKDGPMSTDPAVDTDGYAARLLAIATKVSEAESDGSTLVFKGLDYGYYVVTTTQGEQTITIVSTNPNAKIYDKNNTEPYIPEEPEKSLGKVVDDKDVYIGETVTYTLKLVTSNFDGAGEDAKKIVSYTVKDTLPEYLSDVQVTGITVTEGENVKTLEAQQFAEKQIVIPWVDANGDSLYKNGSTLTITYTAKVTGEAAINAGNENTVSFTWNTVDPDGPYDPENPGDPSDKTLTDTEIIYTYALAIQKVDEDGKPLAGATFTVNGYTVEKVQDGYYKITGAQEGESAEMVCDANGLLVIEGVASKSDTADANGEYPAIEYIFTEVNAPEGYNKLTAPVKGNAQVLSEEVKTTATVVHYDKDGNVTTEESQITSTKTEVTTNLSNLTFQIVNLTGAELPSTGGIGTTIFYVVGGILVIGACVLLVTKKRMGNRG